MSTGELASFITVLCFMVRQEVCRAEVKCFPQSPDPSQIRFRRLKREIYVMSGSSDSPVLRQAPIVKYRSTILRIGERAGLINVRLLKMNSLLSRLGLYPLLSCFWSVTGSVLEVYIITHIEMTDKVRVRRFTNECPLMFLSSLWLCS